MDNPYQAPYAEYHHHLKEIFNAAILFQAWAAAPEPRYYKPIANGPQLHQQFVVHQQQQQANLYYPIIPAQYDQFPVEYGGGMNIDPAIVMQVQHEQVVVDDTPDNLKLDLQVPIEDVPPPKLRRHSEPPPQQMSDDSENDLFKNYITETETAFGTQFTCKEKGCSYQTFRRIDAKRHYEPIHANIKHFVCRNDPVLLAALGGGHGIKGEFAGGCKMVKGGCGRRFARKEHLKTHLKRKTVEQKRSRRELRKVASAEARLGR